MPVTVSPRSVGALPRPSRSPEHLSLGGDDECLICGQRRFARIHVFVDGVGPCFCGEDHHRFDRFSVPASELEEVTRPDATVVAAYHAMHQMGLEESRERLGARSAFPMEAEYRAMVDAYERKLEAEWLKHDHTGRVITSGALTYWECCGVIIDDDDHMIVDETYAYMGEHVVPMAFV